MSSTGASACRRCSISPATWSWPATPSRDVVLAGYTAACGDDKATVVTALRACAGPDARRRLADAIGYRAAANTSDKLAVPGRAIYYPGKLGRVEP